MPKLNPYLENKKLFETAQELKDEYKVPSYEEFVKSYENDERISESYENEIRGYGGIGEVKGYGPTYYPDHILSMKDEPAARWDSVFAIEYTLDEGMYPKNRRFFKFSGTEYSTTWTIRGDLDQIMSTQDDIEEGRIKIVEADCYKRDEGLEEEVKRQLRKDIRKFELAARNGEKIPKLVSGTFRWVHAYNIVCYRQWQTA